MALKQIEIIDIDALFGSDLIQKLQVSKKIDNICRKHGFFQITNHRIDNIKSLSGQALRFFKTLTQEQKMELASNRFNHTSSNKYRGYFPSTINGKEGFDIGNPFLNPDQIKVDHMFNELSVWPSEELLPNFKNYFQKFYTEMVYLTQVLLRGFALAAGKEENFFQDKIKIDDTMSTLRLNFYPFLDNIDAVEIAEDGTRLGCETHQDGSLLTILYQPIEGLQVEDDTNGWIDVPPSDSNFVINTGKLMSRWTNGVFKAANHRVKFVNKERVSVPFFAEPYFDCSIESFTPKNSDILIEYQNIIYGNYLVESNKKFKEYQN